MNKDMYCLLLYIMNKDMIVFEIDVLIVYNKIKISFYIILNLEVLF